MKLTPEQKRSRQALFQFLAKLGIKSAQLGILESMQDWMERVMANYGKPDQLIMSASALETLMSSLGPASPLEAADKEGPVQSEEVPADKRD